MTKEELYRLMEEPDRLSETTEQELEKVVENYPCFQTSRLLYTMKLDHNGSDRYGEELARTAVLCSDRRRLLYLMRREQYAKFLTTSTESDKQTGDRTEALLDSFLSTLPEKGPKDDSLSVSHQHVAGTDYFAYLESLGDESLGEVEEGAERENESLQHQDIIDAFIERAATDDLFTPPEQSSRVKEHEEESKKDGGEFLTETLARIYIKQQKYEQALTIIRRLSLNFPKKSVYFADQIRFLEYLIANEKLKNN